ncbi:hypothetical protein GCM10010430_68800 [Kitasatospora cystarginea]|uniref:Uncharacterized protein n=1 Tax=Kitasatospora cystarginea TaxID=58350 RepID=A0ABP5RS19_9ACTN
MASIVTSVSCSIGPSFEGTTGFGRRGNRILGEAPRSEAAGPNAQAPPFGSGQGLAGAGRQARLRPAASAGGEESRPGRYYYRPHPMTCSGRKPGARAELAQNRTLMKAPTSRKPTRW